MSMLTRQPTDDMAAILSSVQRALSSHAPWQLDAGQAGWADACDRLWQQACELGWLSMLAPPQYDGLGLSLLDAAQLVEETGRHLLPLPISDAIALAGLLGSLPKAGPADIVSAWLAGACHLALVSPTFASDADGAGWRDDGAADADAAAWAEFARQGVPAVQARHADGMLQLVCHDTQAPGVGLDPVIQVARLQPATARLCREQPCHVMLWQRYGQTRRLLRLAEMLGVASAALDAAVAYACERTQFGRPIGANQGLQHPLADAWMALDNAGLALRQACKSQEGAASDQMHGDAVMAEYLVTQAARDVTALAIQVHGAMGITWEATAHRYLKRVRHLLAIPRTHADSGTLLTQLWDAGLAPWQDPVPGMRSPAAAHGLAGR